MTRHAHRTALLLATGLGPLAGACIDRAVTEVTPQQETVEQLEFHVNLNPNLDLLFVVDDSGSMEREQDEIVENFERMIEVLETLPTGLPNIHLGVVSTDVGGGEACGGPPLPAGVLRNQPRIPGCSPPAGRFIIDVDDGAGGRTRNYTGALADTFACVATLGTDGCGFEQPLEAMRLALSPATAENAGFVRDGALLAVVLLTDEDDCSAFDDGLFARDAAALGPLENFRCFEHGIDCEGVDPRTLGPRENCVPRDDSPYLTPIDEYVAALREVKPLDSSVIVAGIMGDAGPVEIVRNERGNLDVKRSCEIGVDDPQGAFPPVRTDAFLDRLPNTVRTRICDADLSPAMIEIAQEIAADLYGGCLDNDPRPQLDCSVTEIQRPLRDDEVRTVLPRCADPASPPAGGCWAVAPDPACEAVSAHGLRLVLHYPDDVTRANDTIVRAQCRVAP